MTHPAIIFMSGLAWTAIGAVGSAVAAIAALAAVSLAVPALKLNAKSIQINVLDSTFKDIRQLEHVWVENGLGDGFTEEQRQAWCASFFNTIEYMCFLTNHKLVDQKELREFFDSALLLWWDQFGQYRSRGWIKDKESSFTEFKAACNRLQPPANHLI